jgi:hypothetical protein
VLPAFLVAKTLNVYTVRDALLAASPRKTVVGVLLCRKRNRKILWNFCSEDSQAGLDSNPAGDPIVARSKTVTTPGRRNSKILEIRRPRFQAINGLPKWDWHNDTERSQHSFRWDNFQR